MRDRRGAGACRRDCPTPSRRVVAVQRDWVSLWSFHDGLHPYTTVSYPGTKHYPLASHICAESGQYLEPCPVSETADVVIAGAGIIGLCAALQIARRSTARVLVLEKGRGLGEGSTGASSAVCRAKYSRDETVILARDGIAAYRHWKEFLSLSDPLATLHELGVVWLSDGRAGWPQTEAERMRRLGVAAEAVDDSALAERYPALNPCAIAPDLETGETHSCGRGGHHLIETLGGYVDPVDALADLLRAVRQLGVEVRFNSKVTGVEKRNGAIHGIVLESGARIGCGALVTTNGPWCNDLFVAAGLHSKWPLVPTRIQVVHLDRPSSVKGEVPVCADPVGGIYFRPQNRGQQLLVGSVMEEDEQEEVADPDHFDRGIDDDFLREKVHLLQHRVRGLDVIRGLRGYSGLYTTNPIDVHPVVGKTPIPGLYVANGFSGHGFKMAPAISSLIAQAVTGQRISGDTMVSPGYLAFDRTPIAVASRNVLA
ncbi:FAD-binding oxidoreductase [Novosphingobium sp. Gsoil 351]|uniref:NAD(P)/FAD-dependent oxidoreductase n=1 Tax=Novosphingobium sp. Gsoil 351 TaxID=2675225 RepID=UPI0012B4738F|nr:FAD-dependent oxidoreductase [Novosphingobium sp. Gsoil 351]QGN55642.1 FAD-dependent oxidoreductase [Novosphingobium sp. Gsoil 351]